LNVAAILIIDDEQMLAESMAEALTLGGHEVQVTATAEAGLQAARGQVADLIVLDYRLPTIDGLEVLRRLREQGDTASVVMVTAHGDIHTAVQAMKVGAADFLQKPLDLDDLQLTVQRVLARRQVSTRLSYFRDRERSESELNRVIGESPAMRAVKDVIRRIVSTAALSSSDPPSLLITGETGTGKDLLARVIHYCGPRCGSQFVQVNCTAMPANMVESELFGHVKGAFTDARAEKQGLFQVADGGTLFLDEIGDMSPDLQAKLLSALDQQAIRPVGGTRARPINVHVIAATNRRLEAAIEAGQFREDLYHRLRVLTLAVPALRERGEDVLQLAEHFLREVSTRFGIEVQGFSDPARQALQCYHWPGNVRELLHVVESAVLTADGCWIRPEHLRLPQAPGGGVRINLPGIQRTIAVEFSGSGARLADVEYQIIVAALEYSKYNLSRAARLLGISRDAVRYRKERYEAGASRVEE
jgi:DNA-binding NtrC family response regulator